MGRAKQAVQRAQVEEDRHQARAAIDAALAAAARTAHAVPPRGGDLGSDLS